MTLRPLLRPALRTAGGSGATEAPAVASPQGLSRRLPRPELLGLLAVAAVLNLWALDLNGTANGYYAAAVRSMTSSWHAFIYNSFDAAGVMTVDKPPLALWVQAASAKAFGFNSWALLGPQALMGVASVALTYDLTRRRFGRPAGFAAGLALALTPVTVAISRHNNPDALLVLCCVAALWLVVRALEDGRTRWLAGAGVAIGLGFETKMAAALIVVPALAGAVLYAAPRGRLAAIRSLLAGGVAILIVGGAWPLLIALTPAADRPWVSGTADNSIWSLILDYNGVGRVSGQLGGPGGAGPGGGAGGVFGGDTGVLRLLGSSLGGQAGWLIGFAIVAAAGLAVATRGRRADARTGWLIATGGAFATTAIVFSAASGIFHPYYVSLLAPFTAALVGGGVGLVLQGGRFARVVAPPAIAAGVASELYVLGHAGVGAGWASPLVVAAGMVTAGVLAAAEAPRIRAAALAVAVAALLAAPASWAVQTLGHAASGTFPAGGPASAATMGGPPGGGRMAGGFPGAGGPFGGSSASLRSAIAYAQAHGGGTIAVASQMTASDVVASTGADVAGIGGFSGRESDVPVSWFANAVQAGRIRWVVADSGGMGMPQDGRTGATTVMAAVQKTCRSVANGTLYDCAGAAPALRATAA